MKKHRRMSLAMLAALLCIVLAVSPILGSAVYFTQNVSRKLENMARSSAELCLAQLSENMENTMNSIRSSIFLLTTNSSVRAIMASETQVDTVQKQAMEDELGQILLYSAAWNLTSLKGVYLYKGDGTYFTMLREGIYNSAAQRTAEVYRRTKGQNSARELLTFEDFPGYAYCVVDYTDLELMNPRGKMIFELHFGGLSGTSYITSLYSGAKVFLVGPNNSLYFASDEAATADFLPFLHTRGAGEADSVKIGDEAYYHAQHRVSGYDIRIDAFLPRAEILASVNTVVRVYLIVSLAILLATLALGALAYVLLTGPLRRMVATIYRMARGDLSVRMEATPYKETEQIVTAFNTLGDELKELFAKVYEQGLTLREAEFELLESQISPHFIFNVLESINMRAAQAGQMDVCQVVTSLAELLRANILHKGRQKVTFRQELEYVNYYLSLQKMRFEDKLNYSIEFADEDVLNCYLPKLTIQPLVENAVVHGTQKKRCGGRVSVRIWEEDCIYIRVQDDGAGFDPAALPKEGDGGNHIALENVCRRLELLYGAPYGIQISSAIGKGTIVTVTVPRDEKGELLC